MSTDKYKYTVSAKVDSDELKVLCKIKTKSSDFSLLLGWK